MAASLLVRILVVVACGAGAVVSLIARDSRLAQERLIVAFVEERDPAKARHALEDARPLNPDYVLDLARSRLQPDRGPAILRRAIAREPENAELWLLLAELERRARNEEAARQAYLRARELAPRLPPYTPPRGP